MKGHDFNGVALNTEVLLGESVGRKRRKTTGLYCALIESSLQAFKPRSRWQASQMLALYFIIPIFIWIA